ncbi:hypothetical protein SG0102_22580 [Intestinibaculum porci]|uniref:Collagen-binding protein n=1 Tax=Intestinibaculum porci TaxID=2487118 RepID=A0A3G9JX00_9FIRM|nr:Cna B-type domain-containing protein [Intestinibaculum porci]BBH27324.1 hypothetical protein SG0102_22580 [Intestinibaculum porci]
MTRSNLKRISVNSLAILFVLALALMDNTGFVKAEDATELTNIKVTDFNLTTTDGKTPEDGFYSYNRVQLAIAWDASAYGNSLKEGDYFTITLPNNFKFPTTSEACNFDLYAPNGSVMAKAVVSPNTSGGGTIKVTFTDYVNDRSNIKGTVKLSASFYNVKKNETNSFTVTVEGETKTINVPIKESVGLRDEILSKWADMNESSDTETLWSGRINWMKKDLQNAVITDTLTTKDGDTTGIRFIKGSLKLEEVEFGESGNVLKNKPVPESAYTVEYSNDDRTMTIKLGNVGTKQYTFQYETTYVKGKTIDNTMTLKADDVKKQYDATYREASSSGTGDGDLNSKIIISKVDSENNDKKLAGATFVITNKSSGKTYEITTDAEGQAISEKLSPGEYEVKETKAPAGYTPNSTIKTVTVVADSKTSLTIEDTPQKVSIPVKKIWKGETGKSATIYLLRNGTRTGDYITLNANTGWHGTFKDLRKTDSTGKDYTYSVEEEKMEGYTSSVTGDVSNGFTITNVRSEKTCVSGEKTWNDANNQDGIRPSKITVNLLRNGEKIDLREVSEQTQWKYNFTNLEKYDADGKPYTYLVTEDNVNGYTTEIYGYNITNKRTPDTTSATVTKTWNDSDNQDGKCPSSVKVQLYANDEKYGDAVNVTQNSKWTYTWTNLPAKKNGKTIADTVKEDVPEGYTATYDTSNQGNVVITNTHAAETTSVEGHKEWDNQNNHDGVRPHAVTVNLLADGIIQSSVVVSAKTNWSYSFNNLPVYNNGQKIIYSVTENSVLGYSTSIDGYNIINTRTSKTTSATVTKQWDDQQNQDGLRPVTVKVQLYANGQKYGNVIKLSDTSKWTYTWINLPVMKNGNKVTYSVKEVSVPKGYTVSVDQNNHGNMIIINSHMPVSRVQNKV